MSGGCGAQYISHRSAMVVTSFDSRIRHHGLHRHQILQLILKIRIPALQPFQNVANFLLHFAQSAPPVRNLRSKTA